VTDREPHAAMLRHLDHCERAIDAMLKASSTAIDFIERRVETLMLDPLANVELLEDIQAEGGAAHDSMTSALRLIAFRPAGSASYEAGMSAALALLHHAARRRAWREFNALPTTEAS